MKRHTVDWTCFRTVDRYNREIGRFSDARCAILADAVSIRGGDIGIRYYPLKAPGPSLAIPSSKVLGSRTTFCRRKSYLFGFGNISFMGNHPG